MIVTVAVMAQAMRARPVRAALAILCVALPFAAFGQPASAAAHEPRVGQTGKDVAWIPTPDEMVEKMLDAVEVAPGERLVDLGSGDGKIAIAAARRGALAMGIEYDAGLVAHSRKAARAAKVDVDLVRGDIFESDFSGADIVTMYLLWDLNQRLRPTLLAMKPGTRVVSHYYDMGDWQPDETLVVDGREAYFWRVPARIAGEWEVRIGNGAGPALRIQQRLQKFSGVAAYGNRVMPLREATLRGPTVKFSFDDADGRPHRVEAVTDHEGPMRGVIVPARGGAAKLFIATRR